MMENKKIKLAYRVVIDTQSQLLWDQFVFEDTYREYLMQQQLYNNKDNVARTFRELLSQNENAKKLHYLVGIAADAYVAQLKGRLHRLPDVLGNHFFAFENYRLDIINTDITDRSKHRIAITFYSPMLLLVAIVNNCYLVSENTDGAAGVETLMYPFQPNLAVCYVQN